MAHAKNKSKDKAAGKKTKKHQSPDGKVKKTKGAKHTATSAKVTADKKRAKKKHKAAGGNMTPEERHQMIAVAAFYRAQQRGFQCRCQERDWFEAAAEIDDML